jgi:hypothetical protein
VGIDDASLNEFLQEVDQQLKSNKSTNNKQEIYLEDENGIPLSGFEAYPFIKEGLKKKWESNPDKIIRNALIQLVMDSKDDSNYTYLNAIEDLSDILNDKPHNSYTIAKGVQEFTNWYLKNYKKGQIKNGLFKHKIPYY